MAVLEATNCQCPRPHVPTSPPKRQRASVVKALRKSAPTWRKAENIFTCLPLPGFMPQSDVSYKVVHKCGSKSLRFERQVAYIFICQFAICLYIIFIYIYIHVYHLFNLCISRIASKKVEKWRLHTFGLFEEFYLSIFLEVAIAYVLVSKGDVHPRRWGCALPPLLPKLLCKEGSTG